MKEDYSHLEGKWVTCSYWVDDSACRVTKVRSGNAYYDQEIYDGKLTVDEDFWSIDGEVTILTNQEARTLLMSFSEKTKFTELNPDILDESPSMEAVLTKPIIESFSEEVESEIELPKVQKSLL